MRPATNGGGKVHREARRFQSQLAVFRINREADWCSRCSELADVSRGLQLKSSYILMHTSPRHAAIHSPATNPSMLTDMAKITKRCQPVIAGSLCYNICMMPSRHVVFVCRWRYASRHPFTETTILLNFTPPQVDLTASRRQKLSERIAGSLRQDFLSGQVSLGRSCSTETRSPGPSM